jgi:hypothetical protein
MYSGAKPEKRTPGPAAESTTLVQTCRFDTIRTDIPLPHLTKRPQNHTTEHTMYGTYYTHPQRSTDRRCGMRRRGTEGLLWQRHSVALRGKLCTCTMQWNSAVDN